MFTTGAIAFEDNYITYAELKRFGKYMEDVRPLHKMGTQEYISFGNIYGRLFKRQALLSENNVSETPQSTKIESSLMYLAASVTKYVCQTVNCHDSIRKTIYHSIKMV